VDGRTYGRTDVRTGGRTFSPSILLGRLSEVDLKINAGRRFRGRRCIGGDWPERGTRWKSWECRAGKWEMPCSCRWDRIRWEFRWERTRLWTSIGDIRPRSRRAPAPSSSSSSSANRRHSDRWRHGGRRDWKWRRHWWRHQSSCLRSA